VGRRWSYLSRLLPDQLDSIVDASSGGPEEPELLFRAVTGFLQAIAEVIPVAILLDDLHWADSASLLEQRPPSPSLAMLYVALVRLYNVTGR
jgi:hypothetical protein